MACSQGGTAFLTNLFVAASLKLAAERERQVIMQAGSWRPAASVPVLRSWRSSVRWRR